MSGDGAAGALHVLVVDDSAVVREAMADALAREGGLTVQAVPDARIALERIKKRRPDVILLDLDMPGMDGLAFLRRLMADDPIPVVVCSALGGRGTDAALEAVWEGATEVVAKPRLGVRDFIHDSAVLLVDAVRAAAKARLAPRRGPVELVRRNADAVLPPAEKGPRLATDRVAALGASTGGTEALLEVLSALPPDSPGLVVVQHMPEAFTRSFANRLDRLCRVEVKEAADGDAVLAGRALIAPGNHHMVLERKGTRYAVRVVDGPLVSRHRPSVDVLFRSVAREAGANAMGVLMTGMGNDGVQGLLEMKQAGARTLVQDEASCVVFGMPKEALAAGAAREAVPLSLLSRRILGT